MFISCAERTDNLSIQTSEFSSDTLEAGKYVLSFENSDSFPTTDIYGDLTFRRQLTDTIGNWHERAEKIELYLTTKYSGYFFTEDSTLSLKLGNGAMERFPKWDQENEVGYNFEHYFENIDYYLLRVQLPEGNSWMLVNRKNGFRKYINGLPYISKDGKKILAINSDLEAGYSFTGIELYTILKDSLQQEMSKETKWGPVDIKWINENQFLIKREIPHFDSLTENLTSTFQFKEVTIRKKTSR